VEILSIRLANEGLCGEDILALTKSQTNKTTNANKRVQGQV